jgi:hypothetical protein
VRRLPSLFKRSSLFVDFRCLWGGPGMTRFGVILPSPGIGSGSSKLIWLGPFSSAARLRPTSNFVAPIDVSHHDASIVLRGYINNHRGIDPSRLSYPGGSNPFDFEVIPGCNWNIESIVACCGVSAIISQRRRD